MGLEHTCASKKMIQNGLTNNMSRKENLNREYEGYKIQVKSLDLTRKINCFLSAACIVGIFYDNSIKHWYFNQYVIAGIFFGLISFFSHKKWIKILQSMRQIKLQIEELKNKK